MNVCVCMWVCRQWRSGVGDASCLQANICNFGIYTRALPTSVILKHFAYVPEASPEKGAASTAQGDGTFKPDGLLKDGEEDVSALAASKGGGLKDRHVVRQAKYTALRHR